MDKIIINHAKFAVNLGITKEERAQKQDILIDVVMFYDFKNATYDDDISKTINYSLVCKHIAKILVEKEYNLIETIAQRIATDILELFGVKKVEVSVIKPQALRVANYAAVEILRERV